MGTKARLVAAAILLLAFFYGCSDRSTAPSTEELLGSIPKINWVGTDVVYSSTIQKKNLSLLMFLTATCNGCTKYRKETLRNANVIKIISESYNACQVDPTADSQVVYFDRKVSCENLFYNIYNFDNYPALVILDRKGHELDRITGYKPPVSFIPYLDSIRRVNQ